MNRIIIDRRKNDGGKSTGNKRKFHRRVHKHIKRQIDESIRDGNIGDIMTDNNERIKIPVKDINEPFIHHGQGGHHEQVRPGNKEFVEGDRIPRPEGGSGSGSGGGEASPDGDGEDEFTFTITRDEFIQYFFEDLELPDLVQKQLSVIEQTKPQRAGYSTDGSPSRLDMLQTMKQSVGRRIALRNPKKKKLKQLREELALLEQTIRDRLDNGEDVIIETKRKEEIEQEILVLERKLRAVSFVDDEDLRFRQWKKVPQPVFQAVMFCIMDVSGSMTENKKDLAKRFYMLLYMFLYKNYDKIDIVFIRHHSSAKEVDEEEFFYSKESGGTMVSPALELMIDIAKQRYPLNRWNLYVAQTSDGDNWGDDNYRVYDLIKNKILPMVQYYMYIETETGEWGRAGESDLWGTMERLSNESQNMDMGMVTQRNEIFPVFRGLFKRK